jgi:hypothetical protein
MAKSSKIKVTTEMLKNYVDNLEPIEIKKLHIKQAKALMKAYPELADQIEPLLKADQRELKELQKPAQFIPPVNQVAWPFEV